MLIDTTEAARRLNLSRPRVIQLLNEGRVAGATKIGSLQRGHWVINVPDHHPPTVHGRKMTRLPATLQEVP